MKFRWKVTLCTVCMLSLLFGAGSSALFALSFKNALGRELAGAKRSYQTLLSTLQMADEMGALRNSRQLSALLTQLTPGETAPWAAWMLTSGGEELFHTGAAGSLMPSAQATEMGRNTVFYFKDAAGRQYLQLSGCFSVDDEQNVLTIAYDISPLYNTRHSQQTAYLGIFAAMLCGCLLFSYLTALGLTRPLTRLSAATRAIAEGDLSVRADLRSDDEIGAVGADFDVMAAKTEETVRQLQSAMERQERFIGSFTHEMKTPMTVIIGYADLLRQQNLTPSEQQDAANYIFSEARRLEQLSLKLLEIEVAEHTEQTLVPVSPAALLQELTKHLQPSFSAARLTLTQSCGEGLCRLDADLVRSLLLNLADNARKATPPGGVVSLMGELTEDGCVLTVSDTGCGIPPEASAHLTEAFYRVDKARSRAQGGAGLGLTLCARIAELHGGTLHFESVPGKGTSVVVELKGGRA